MRILLLVTLVIVLSCASGCASVGTYFKDRGNDLADCFKLDVGYGYGLDARVKCSSFLSLCIGGSQVNKFGLRGRDYMEWEERRIGIVGMFFYSLAGNVSPCPATKVSLGDGLAWGCIVSIGGMQIEEYSFNNKSLHKKVGNINNYTVWVVTLYEDRYAGSFENLSFLDIEIGATAGVIGLNIGFSPGQFVDFLLGWTTLDIVGDDTASLAEVKKKGPKE